jgi:hypothetical protein
VALGLVNRVQSSDAILANASHMRQLSYIVMFLQTSPTVDETARHKRLTANNKLHDTTQNLTQNSGAKNQSEIEC